MEIYQSEGYVHPACILVRNVKKMEVVFLVLVVFSISWLIVMLLVLRNRPLSTQCVYALLVCPLRGSVLISVMVDILTSMEYAGVVIIIVYNVKMHQINARNAKEDGV